ncbi:MAG TPA: UDP-3-O-acyl-N-acetylglucosamine deacetylase [Paludibacter sp.]|nr:UDP-3-O-acyl-N-acetylglucosamine deacetylase [Paludibacter sp.]
MPKQNTIKNSFSFQGKGLHTGLFIHLTFIPAPENHGIKIRRIDMPDQPVIDAVADYVGQTQRGTILKKDDFQVSTIEHAMASLYAMGIDNCMLEVDAPEFPILDGSAKLYVEKILESGIQEQQSDREYFVVKNKIEYTNPETGSHIMVVPDEDFSVNVQIGFKSSLLKNQYATLENLKEFATEVSAARTFVFVREIKPLIKMNLIKGGDLKNAVVIYDELISQESMDRLTEKLGQPHIDASKLGYLSGDLKYENEPARHKLIDVIGDLALVGRQIIGKVVAVHPGHKTNTELAKLIRNVMLNENS